MVNLFPQEHFDGISRGVQPYLRARASKKPLLWRAKPCSFRGRAVSHVDAPLSPARAMALCSGSGTQPGSVVLSSLAVAVAFSLSFFVNRSFEF